MSKNNTNKKENAFLRFFKTIGRWAGRAFFGGSRALSMDDALSVEKIESPSVMAVKTFFRRKLAVVALVVLISLFLLVFIGPLFIPMDLNHTDNLQANIAPTMSMRSVPKDLKNNIRNISGKSNFTLGVSNDNNLYIWGYTNDPLANIDYSEFPEEIKEGNVLNVAAGVDHIIAVTTDGKVIGWGDHSRGQYGEADPKDGLIQIPDEVANGIDPTKLEQLEAGYQATAMIVDGTLYMWGNGKACLNMSELSVDGDAMKALEEGDTTIIRRTGVKKVSLTNYYAVLLMEDGSVTGGNSLFVRESATSSKTTVNENTGKSSNKVKNFMSYLDDQRDAGNPVVDIATTDNCYAFLLADGEILIAGATENDENVFPTLASGEKFVSLDAGTKHFVGITDQGKAYAWGHNDHGQSDVKDLSAATAFAGAKQTYVVNEEGELVESFGLKGYLFGTDKSGRDIFTRIVHGGKMTMTVGAVAVIVSTIIAIIVGCLSGYFGGWVDMLLMRVTEIFSAIPFLPFAMMLSFILRNKPMEEKTRIFIIMIILGLLSWTGLARMIRGQVLAEREKEFVVAAKSMGVKEKRIAFKHILPNVISVILVSVTLDFAGCLLTESSLSYLGFGVQQPQPTWGNMLNGANNSIVIQNYWWQWVFPAIFLSIATICINIIGDTLRDVLDPKSSREK